MTLIRRQILLTSETDAVLRFEALRLGISVSELIRRQVEALDLGNIDNSEDPLLALEGFLGEEPDGATDVSERHDEYLYGRRSER